MKPLHVLTASCLALLPACTKTNDVAVLHDEAVAVGKFYQPKLDQLARRVEDIFKRGSTIPANLPGIEEVGKRLNEAREKIIELRGISAPDPKGKSAIETQADGAAKDGEGRTTAAKIVDLDKLIDDTRDKFEEGVVMIDDDLGSVESWISQYERNPVPATPPAAPPPAPSGPITDEPGTVP